MFSVGSESVGGPNESTNFLSHHPLFSSASIHTSKLLSSINVVFWASWVQTLYLSLVVGPSYGEIPWRHMIMRILHDFLMQAQSRGSTAASSQM